MGSQRALNPPAIIRAHRKQPLHRLPRSSPRQIPLPSPAPPKQGASAVAMKKVTAKVGTKLFRAARPSEALLTSSPDCKKDVTLYRAKSSKAVKVATHSVPCPKSATQACAHYYSVIQAGRSATFSCEATQGGRPYSPATGAWHRSHADKTWKAFTAANYYYNEEHKNDKPNCQADEWPPSYWLSREQTKEGTKSTKGQLVRWIPELPNGNAGELWHNFCADNDGDVGNGQRDGGVTNPQWKEGGK